MKKQVKTAKENHVELMRMFNNNEIAEMPLKKKEVTEIVQAFFQAEAKLTQHIALYGNGVSKPKGKLALILSTEKRSFDLLPGHGYPEATSFERSSKWRFTYCGNYLETSGKFWQRNLTLFTHLDRVIPQRNKL